MTTEPALTIRAYRNTDHLQVVKLNAYGLAAAGVPADVDVYAGDLDNITGTYLTGRATMLIGELDGRLVAMGALRQINDTTCEITRMRVTPEAQGRGYGKQILAALEACARDFGYLQAILLTGPDQHPAIDIYQTAEYRTANIENYGDIGLRKKLLP
jgi:GNAT superfamily N-acetyltransferase